jgi:hypothetical protein
MFWSVYAYALAPRERSETGHERHDEQRLSERCQIRPAAILELWLQLKSIPVSPSRLHRSVWTP